MDFYRILEKELDGKNTGKVEVYPDFIVKRSKDLMMRGKAFYGVWDEERQMWSTDEYDVARLVDEDIRKYEPKAQAIEVKRKYLSNFSSAAWLQFRNYLAHLTDSFHQLDETLTFEDTEIKKEDYVSRRLPYRLESGPIPAYEELFSLLYTPDELAKLEWAVGAIISGDSKRIQKFLVLYGSPGTGKSTWLDLVMWLTEGYWVTFDAKALTSANNQFAMEAFRSNPLIAIDHDTDLSKIADNSKINSVVSHEDMQINEKNKPTYNIKLMAMLLIGTNKPVRITNAKAGILRRLIDVQPTGKTHAPRKYQTLVGQMKFELGAIAAHCLEVYRSMGKDYYSGYRPTEMMLETDVFFNYIEAYFDVFKDQDGATLKQAYTLYKEYCADTNVDYVMAQYKFREEFKNYFETFDDRRLVDGVQVRSWYGRFNADRFKTKAPEEKAFSLVMEDTESIFDKDFAGCVAQYGNEDGTPVKYWDASPKQRDGKEYIPKLSETVQTVLSQLDTGKLHYVKVPSSHIVIDFDLKGPDGEKSLERNLEAASSWPSTYAELSQGGKGIHLHYNYIGDVSELSRVYDDGIEVKVFTGNSSLRRRLTKCNNIEVADLSVGLPLKEKKVLVDETIQSEKHLRALIMKGLNKEVHAGTKPSVDFIHKILEDAHRDGLRYDVTDLRGRILAFANNSSNHNLDCIKLVQTMQFKSEDVLEEAKVVPKDERLVIFDVEVFPNLFIICWKYKGSKQVVRMVNPTAVQVEELFALKLAGYNCRRYDNHIIYAAAMGYSNLDLYKLSQKIVNNIPSAMFGAAYNLSYLDIFDMANVKKSLKLWEVELDIPHKENDLPWDEPVPEEKWKQVEEYCVNDVNATEVVLDHLEADYIARQLLADLSGLSLNHTTQQHASKIIFGDNSRPQSDFVYTDLSRQFDGYKFENGKSTYRGEDPSEGGYVYAEPGMYENVVELDAVSMHPTSIEQLNLFGEYTEKFSELKNLRVAIKEKRFDDARKMLGGKVTRYLDDESLADKLAYALKIVINIVYGLTSARFENSFKDPKNIDNIVAKRGALTMIDLKHAVQEKGFTVVHIKTDSIKIANATPEIIQFVKDFGKSYGYEFEEAIKDGSPYLKVCLVNDAVFVAQKSDGSWKAVGAQFQHPYVFKTLFSKEPIAFKDLCETRSVTTALYLDFADDTPMAFGIGPMHFVGKTGSFCPIEPGKGGAQLLRAPKEEGGKFSAVSGSKGYDWLESEIVREFNKEGDIDMRYFDNLVNQAVEKINTFGDFEWFRG